jgi:putative restriction endonuclease
MAGDRITARYARRFAGLRRDVSRARWTESTRNGAPHKPLLLLSVLDLFEQSRITSNLIELAPDLGELFTRYWTRILPPDRRGKLAPPYFRLRSDGFWQLVPKPGKQDVVKYAVQIRSLTRLQDAVIGARLYAELYGLLQAQGPRDALRTVLIEAFFAPEVRSTLTEQGAINHEGFRYSEQLLRRGTGRLPNRWQKRERIGRLQAIRGFAVPW